MITASNLSMRYGAKILFKEASLQLNPSTHYGLVGPNGSGKSTLIKILTGDIAPESGELTLPSRTILGSLKQDHFQYDSTVILDVVLMGKEKLWNAINIKKNLLNKLELSEGDTSILEQCEKIIEENDGYAAESQSAQLLEGLGIPTHLHHEEMKVLSGGYKLRVLLAQLLFSSPSVLILDEPTNHLDIYSIKWLESYLKNFPGTLLLSSHDKQFLNSVCDSIIDLDYQTLKTYKGNYDAFLLIKNEELVFKENVFAKQEKKKEDLMAFVDKFGAKATKARQAQSRLKQAEKLEASMEALNIRSSSRQYPKLKFSIPRPSAAIALKVQDLNKSYGQKQVLSKLSFEVERGERVAFIGANGIGKSTLLEILSNHLSQDRGDINWGFASHFAYFPQDHAREVYGNISLLDWLSQFDRQATQESLREILARALFCGDEVHKSVNVLSGGETARLILAKLMLLKHNTLIFDEPTNHLDMEATESLVKALNEYPGTLLFVSHNRYFISQLATRIIEMTKDGVEDFKCGYNEYIQRREIDLLEATKAAMRLGTSTDLNSKTSGKEDYIEQKRQQKAKDQMAKKVTSAEALCVQIDLDLSKINEQLCQDGFYQNTSKQDQEKILKQKEMLEDELKEAFRNWEQLNEIYLNQF